MIGGTSSDATTTVATLRDTAFEHRDFTYYWLARVLGRVSAVNAVFVGASNELGEFESGVTAAWWGVVPAVVVGGVATIVVGLGCAWLLPQLRRVDSLDQDDLVGKYR